MRFYTGQHRYYCGIDLHARSMYICMLSGTGKVLLHKSVKATPEAFLRAIKPYRKNVVVAVECMFSWYWLADLCEDQGIPFVIGHALYMKAIHGGKSKNDRIDSQKIAALLKGGLFPMAHVYPRKLRAARDLLRRRMYLMRKRAELAVHVINTNSQYNLPSIGKNIGYLKNRDGVAERFTDPVVNKSIEVDLELMGHYDRILNDLELYLLRTVTEHDGDAIYRLRTIPGVGLIISMAILLEVGEINRFPRVQDFVSYCRMIKPARLSDGKLYGHSGKKIGNAHLKWAFSEAACLFLRNHPEGQRYYKKLKRRHGAGKALSILAHRLSRAAYYILRRRTVFDMQKFLAG